MVFECDMSIVAIKWNHNGSVLALVGSLVIDGDIKESNVLQLYSPFGIVSFQYFTVAIVSHYLSVMLNVLMYSALYF